MEPPSQASAQNREATDIGTICASFAETPCLSVGRTGEFGTFAIIDAVLPPARRAAVMLSPATASAARSSGTPIPYFLPGLR